MVSPWRTSGSHVTLLCPPSCMLTKGRLDPAAARQFFHQLQIRFLKTSDAVRPRNDHLANAYHFTGDIRNAPRRNASRFGVGGGKHGHAQRGLCILGQANGPSEDIGAKLAPVAAASCTACEGQVAADRCTQHIERIEAEPFHECYSL